MAEQLADFTIPIGSGLTPCAPGTGRLSRSRASALAASLRELDVARGRSEIASRTYFVGPARRWTSRPSRTGQNGEDADA